VVAIGGLSSPNPACKRIPDNPDTNLSSGLPANAQFYKGNHFLSIGRNCQSNELISEINLFRKQGKIDRAFSP
jgi:hypothetical protein